ncbi:MAG: hypothetical protein ACM3PA_00110 [Methanomassiliicoccales archaeon]
MRFIKYLNLLLIIGVVVLLSLSLEGCTNDQPTPNQPKSQFSQEEEKRMALYTTVMRAAFQQENGGNRFIAVKLDSLEGISSEAKAKVLEQLQDLSPQVYDYELVKQDPAKFKLEEGGQLQAAKDGTVLSVKLDSYSDNRAIIDGVSWFGNLGAVFPSYEATYKNGQWHLKLISMAIS